MATTYTNMGLKSWNAGADLFSYADLDANWAKIANHDHTSGNGVQVPTDGIADNAITSAKILNDTIVNADINSSAAIVGTKLAANTITNDKIATADLQKLGLSDSTIRRGKSIIATTEVRNNTAYGTLATPDQVANIVLPTDGLLAISYQATWQETNVGAARAAIFLNSNQLRYADGTTASTNLQETPTAANAANQDHPLSTHLQGIKAVGGGGSSAYGGDVTTGQVIGMTIDASAGSTFLGGPCWVFAAAGTYTVSVQFKASAGTVTVKNRKLWVWTIGF